jgi:hypothetical protein
MTAYDYWIIGIGSVSMAGIIWSSYKLNKHRREIRIYRRIEIEAGQFLSSPEWLKNNSKRLVKWFSGTMKFDK